MNSVALIGRLTRDPEIRYTGDQMAIATFSIAIDRPPRRDGTRETDFPRITVFGRQAENCEKYLKKGRMVGVTGRIQTGSYTNRDGQKVYTTEVIVDDQEFADSKGAAAPAGGQNYGGSQNYGGRSQGQNSSAGYQGSEKPAPQSASTEGFMNIPDGVEDEGLPFN